ncbi:MAG TPA: glycosyltransferase [Thermoanaerobaculia bacterium]|nr:glycosyltransferase [Thermoanaerobaculia bacterium]
MPKGDGKLVVAYVLRKFPKLSEAFVLNEILGLERAGVKVQVFSLMPPTDPRFHDGLVRLKAPIWYVPGLADPRDRDSLRRTHRDAARRFGRAYRRARLRALATRRATMLWRFYQAGWIAERAARLGVDRYHAHFATRATTVAGLASSISGLPYSFTAHAVDIYRDDVDLGILRRKIAGASFVATVSESNVEHLRAITNGGGARIELLRNGIDLSRFVPNGAAADPPFKILSVARLVEKKGGEYLIEACRLLSRRGVPFRCDIIGRGHLRAKLLAQIEEAGLADSVRLLGGRKQADVLRHYRSTHVYVLPSIVGDDGNREGLPVSIVEALACAIPVVSTPVAGIPEVVRDGDNGLLVPERDPSALADAIERLIRDPALHARLSARARASVEPAYDTAQSSERLRGLFAGVER